MDKLIALFKLVPITFIQITLDFLSPEILRRRCDECNGEGYKRIEGTLWTSCPVCEIGEDDCPECMGTGRVRVRNAYTKCYCDHGLIPREAAFQLNLVPDLDGYYKDDSINKLIRGKTWKQFKGELQHG